MAQHQRKFQFYWGINMAVLKTASANKPWYKEGWAWGILAGPILVIPAGLITYYIAASGADPLVSDDYYKEGKNIHLQMERDTSASTHHIQAQVMFSPDGSKVRVFLNGEYDPAQAMQFTLQHPTMAQYDQSVALTLVNADAKLYEAQLKPLPPMNSWYVRIENDQATWRVQEKWLVQNGQSLTLTPKYATVTASSPK